MALIKCPECENKISELASSCPHCGFPLSKEIVLKIKNDVKNQIEDELKEKEKKELERREFLDSLENDNSIEEEIPIREINSQISDSRKRKRKTTAYLIIVSFFVLLFILVISSLRTDDEKEPSKKSIRSEEQISDKLNPEDKQEVIKYRVTEKQDVSYLNTPRMVYRIILDVDSLPSETLMKKVATSIWENGNKKWKEFTVFIYLPEMNTGMAAFGVGEFNNIGLVSFNINDYTLFGTKWEKSKQKN